MQWIGGGHDFEIENQIPMNLSDDEVLGLTRGVWPLFSLSLTCSGCCVLWRRNVLQLTSPVRCTMAIRGVEALAQFRAGPLNGFVSSFLAVLSIRLNLSPANGGLYGDIPGEGCRAQLVPSVVSDLGVGGVLFSRSCTRAGG